jgi:hypothetical protein
MSAAAWNVRSQNSWGMRWGVAITRGGVRVSYQLAHFSSNFLLSPLYR